MLNDKIINALIKNLIEFCNVLADIKAPDTDVDLHVITWNNDECIPVFNKWSIPENYTLLACS